MEHGMETSEAMLYHAVLEHMSGLKAVRVKWPAMSLRWLLCDGLALEHGLWRYRDYRRKERDTCVPAQARDTGHQKHEACIPCTSRTDCVHDCASHRG